MSNDISGNIALLSEEDGKKYAGQYVCVERFNSKTVVSADNDPLKARRSAQKNGFSDPVLFYVPRAGETFIYSHASH